jgi:hypothetical protein
MDIHNDSTIPTAIPTSIPTAIRVTPHNALITDTLNTNREVVIGVLVDLSNAETPQCSRREVIITYFYALLLSILFSTIIYLILRALIMMVPL